MKPTSTESPSKRGYAIMISSLIGLYLLDQISKWYIVLNYKAPHDNYVMQATPVISGSDWMNFNIIRIHNTGVAFGFGNGTTWAPILFLSIQVIALIAFCILLTKGFFKTTLLKICWVLIMTGVLGNMTDRLTQGFFLEGAEQLSFIQNLANGYVVDFLDFSFPWITNSNYPYGYHWPAFNVADSCVCCAAALFFIASIFEEKNKKNEAPTKP